MAGQSIFKLGNNLDLTAFTFCLCVVVLITTVFEGILHRLEHWIRHKASDITSEVYMQTLQKLYKELMILGFISFLLSILLQTKTVTDKTVIVSFEYAHFLVFFVALAFILQAIAITGAANIVKKMCHHSQSQSLLLLQEIVSTRQNHRLPVQLWFDCTFKLLSVLFIHANELPSDLNFATYYGMVQDATVVNVLDIEPSSWVTFVAFLMANVGLQQIGVLSGGRGGTGGNSSVAMHSNSSMDTNSTRTDTTMPLESVLEFGFCGWAITGSLFIAVLWVRRHVSRMLAAVFGFIGHDRSEKIDSALLCADAKMIEYEEAEIFMSNSELKQVLNDIHHEERDMTMRNRLDGRDGISAHMLAENVKDVVADLTGNVKDVVVDLTENVKDGVMKIGKGVASAGEKMKGGVTAAAGGLRRASATAVAFAGPPRNKVMPTRVPTKSSDVKNDVTVDSEGNSNMIRVESMHVDSKGWEMSAGDNRSHFSESFPTVDSVDTAPVVVPVPVSMRTFQRMSPSKKVIHRKHVLQRGHLEGVNVTKRELWISNKIIDMLLLLNCCYIAVYICSFAAMSDNTYTVFLLGPFVLNLTILIPALIFCHSLIRATCKLEPHLLGTVLERSDEVRTLMADVHQKITMRLTQIGRGPLDVKKAFSKMDADNSGRIDKKEFRDGLQDLNIFLSQATFDRLFRAIDVDQSGEISYEEFQKVLFEADPDAEDIHNHMKRHLQEKTSKKERTRFINALTRNMSTHW